MYTNANSPYLALTLARQTIRERVDLAEQRALARSLRVEKRALRLERRRLSASPTEQYRLPWWAFRFVHPAA